MLRKISLIISVLVFAWICGCKPTTQNETKHWENHQKEADQLKSKYPNFAANIEQALAKAKPIWEESNKITEEEKKAAKMKEANDVVNKIVAPLKSYESYLNDFTKVGEKVAKIKKLPSSQKALFDNSVRLGNEQSDRAYKLIRTSSTDFEEACKAANDAYVEMMHAVENYKKAEKAASGK